MRAIVLAVSLMSWLVPTFASAEKVKLEVKVVEASVKGNTVDPKLAHLERDLKHFGSSFTSYKMVSEPVATVDYKQSTTINLPNGKQLKLTPVQREKDGRVSIRLEIPGLFDETYSAPNSQRHIVTAGPKDHGSTNESQIIVIVTHTVQ